MRLGQQLAEEELGVAPPVAQPVVPVVLRPPLVRIQYLVEAEDGAGGQRRGEEGPTVAMATTPSTRSGCRAAVSSARQLLVQSPIRTAWPMPAASMTAIVSATNSVSA